MRCAAEVAAMRVHRIPSGAILALVLSACTSPDRGPAAQQDSAAARPSGDDADTTAGAADSAVTRLANCAAPPTRDDRTLCPPDRIGPLRRNTSRADLDTIFPPALLHDQPVDVGEGMLEPGTRINVGRPDSAQIVWADSSRSRIRSVLALGPAWRTPDGLGVGSSLQEIEQRLGVVSVLGFGWDYGGTVTLVGTPLADSGLFFRTHPRSPDARATAAYQRVRGEQSFRSDDPDVRALDPVVGRIDVIWR